MLPLPERKWYWYGKRHLHAFYLTDQLIYPISACGKVWRKPVNKVATKICSACQNAIERMREEYPLI